MIGRDTGMSPTQFWIRLGVLATVAFAIRVGMTVRFVGLGSPPDEEAVYDQVDYEAFAWRLSQGRGYTLEDGSPTARRTPGTSLAILPIYLVLGRDYRAARLWFCFLSAVTCVAAGWVARDRFGPRIGVLVAAWLCLLPNHAYYAMHFTSEVPFALLVTVATGLSIRAVEDRSRRGAVAAGVAWGLGVLVRPHVAVALPLLWLVGFDRPRDGRVMRQLALVCVAAAVCVAPWVIRNRLVLDRAVISTVDGPTFWGAHNHRILADMPGGWLPPSDLVDGEHPLSGGELERGDQMWRYARRFLRENVSSLIYLESMKLLRLVSPFGETENRAVFWSFAVGWSTALICLVPGVVVAFRLDRRGAWMIVCPLLATIATCLIYYGSGRFRDAVAPLYLIVSAVGLSAVVRRVVHRSWEDRGRGIP